MLHLQCGIHIITLQVLHDMGDFYGGMILKIQPNFTQSMMKPEHAMVLENARFSHAGALRLFFFLGKFLDTILLEKSLKKSRIMLQRELYI